MERVITFGEFQGSIGFLAEQELRATLAICAGLANKEIARAFGCAPSTVKKSIERAFFKFGVSSRTALVAEAFKRGLVMLSSGVPPTPQQQNSRNSTNGVFIA